MKKAKLISTLLSVTMSMTSLAGIPLTANAASVSPSSVTVDTAADTATSTSTAQITTAPPVKPFEDGSVHDCKVNVEIDIRNYNTKEKIEGLNVNVYEGYSRTNAVHSFTSGKDGEDTKDYEFSMVGPDDYATYEIIVDNVPEEYNYPSDSTGWMMYLYESTAEKYEGDTYVYTVYLYPDLYLPNVTYTTGTTGTGTRTGTYYTGTRTTELPVTYHTETKPPQRTTTTTATGSQIGEDEPQSYGISFEKAVYNLPVGQRYVLHLNNPGRVKMDYEVEDSNYAYEQIIYPTYVYVYANITGTTKIKAIGENGETAEAVINVIDPVATATTVSGTGTVTTTQTETTYIRTSPTAGLSLDCENNTLYIKPNEVKKFSFTAFNANEVEFKSPSTDVKIVDVEYSGSSMKPAEGKVTISCYTGAEPHGVALYSYAWSSHGEGVKTYHNLMIVPEDFTTTTTLDPNATTVSTMASTTNTVYGTVIPTTVKTTINDVPDGTVTTTTIVRDYGTIADYDPSPMRVGETRKIRFYHPATGTADGLYGISANKECVSYEYNEGDDFITVTALKEGKADISASAKGCAFGRSVRFDIFAADADIITSVSAPDKIVYNKGEKLDISGLKGTVEHADGTTETIDLSDIRHAELTVEELYKSDDFPTLKGGRYAVRIGSRDQTEITIDSKTYGISKDYRGGYSNPTGFSAYISDDLHTYYELKNAKVVKRELGTSAKGLEFKGIDKKFSIDADAWMYADCHMDNLNVGDIVSGVLCLSSSGTYVINGDVTTVWKGGDTNCDNEVNMSDAVLIMQALANPAKYAENGTDKNKLTAQGRENCDTDNDGMTNADALAIQKKLLFLK